MDNAYSTDDPSFTSSAASTTELPTKTQPDDEVAPERSALVKQILGRVQASKKKWGKAFKRMRADMKFAAGQQLRSQREDDDRVQIDIIQRHVNSRMSSLYAKNPTVLAERRPRLNFALWDEQPGSLQQLMQRMQQSVTTGMPPSPQDMALMSDIAQGVQQNNLYKRVGKTMTLMFNYALDEQWPPFKGQIKQLVVRTLTTGVAYVETGYQRALQKSPEVQAGLEDASSKVATLMRLQEEMQEGDIDTYSPDIERLKLMMQDLQNAPEMIVREGLVHNFLASTRVIPDANCTCLEGFIGCREVAIEYSMTADEIEEAWQVDIKGKAKTYTERTDGTLQILNSGSDNADPKYCVFKIFSKADGLVYTVCDGYKDFLEEPAAPIVIVDGFWPIDALTFNKQEAENDPFPRSDVRLLTSLQKEINRNGEGLRQHRIASRPLYIAAPGAFDEDEKVSLANHEAHDVIELQNGDKPIDQILQELKKTPIDPNLYTNDPVYSAIDRVVGSQDTDSGANNSATGDSIDEARRISSLSSNTDDLDELLTNLARKGGSIMLRETSVETVQRIVGPGAVWPAVSAQEVAEQIYLKVKAASTGRPNRAQDLANWEKAMPFLIQIPGMNPQWLAEQFLSVLDDRIDVSEAYTDGLPSIMSANANAQPSTGNPATDPNAQGPQGAGNAPAPPGVTPGPQPALPTGAASPPAGTAVGQPMSA